jgi:hypothetical protein
MKSRPKTPTKNVFPAGWSDAKTRRLAAHYEQQTPDDAAAEDDQAMDKSKTVIEVPAALVGPIVALLAEYERAIKRGKRRSRKIA